VVEQRHGLDEIKLEKYCAQQTTKLITEGLFYSIAKMWCERRPHKWHCSRYWLLASEVVPAIQT